MKNLPILLIFLFSKNIFAQWIPYQNSKNGKYAFVDSSSSLLKTKYVFDYIFPLSKGVYICQLKNNLGAIGSNGQQLIPFNFNYIEVLENDSAIVVFNDKNLKDRFKIKYTDSGIYFKENDVNKFKVYYSIPPFLKHKNTQPNIENFKENQEIKADFFNAPTTSINYYNNKRQLVKPEFDFKFKLTTGLGLRNINQNFLFELNSNIYIDKQHKSSMFGLGLGYKSNKKILSLDTIITIQSVPVSFSHILFIHPLRKIYLKYDIGFHANEIIEYKLQGNKTFQNANFSPNLHHIFFNLGVGVWNLNNFFAEAVYNRIPQRFDQKKYNAFRDNFSLMIGLMF